MRELLMVGAGGFVGAVCRYGLAGMIHRLVPGALFPVGTLGVNILGCFLIGALNGVIEARQVFGPEMRLFLLIGLLGGFTTYSTFGYEGLSLLRQSEGFGFVLYVGLHLAIGLLAVWAGFALGRSW